MNIGFVPYRNAKRFPSNEAVVDENTGKSLTWKEFNDRINRLANGLLAMGFKKGDGVGIYSRNRLEMLEIFFACGKIGMIYQPMNWRFRPVEVAYGLNDGKPPIAVVHQEFAESFNSIRDQCPHIRKVVGMGPDHGLEEDYEKILAGSSTKEPEMWDQIDDDVVVFICYTSGTTGISKGVMLTHKNIFTQIVNQDAVERITRKDVYLLLGQMFHVAVLLCFPYLFHGCKVVVMNFEARSVLEAIQKHKITSLLAISTMLHYLIDVPGFNRYDVSSVRLMAYGEGPMSLTTLRRGMEAFPNAQFEQQMGQTEVAIMALALPPEDHVRDPDEKQYRRMQGCGREAILADVRVV